MMSAQSLSMLGKVGHLHITFQAVLEFQKLCHILGIQSDPSMQPEDVGVNLGSDGNSTVIGSKVAVNSAGEPRHNRSMI